MSDRLLLGKRRYTTSSSTAPSIYMGEIEVKRVLITTEKKPKRSQYSNKRKSQQVNRNHTEGNLIHEKPQQMISFSFAKATLQKTLTKKHKTKYICKITINRIKRLMHT